MKKSIILLAMLISITSFAQYGVNYKALIQQNGNVLANHSVNLRFTLLENSNPVYQETHSATTDANGIVSVNIGEGTVVSGSFPDDWNKIYFYKTEINSGSGYQDFGTQQFKAVPYSYFAFSADYQTLTEAPFGGAGVNADTGIDDNIYHNGKMSIGADSENAQLYVETTESDAISVRSDYSGSGLQVALQNSIYGTSNCNRTGVYNDLRATGDGSETGVYNFFAVPSNAHRIGVDNYLSGNGNGYLYGIYSSINADGVGRHYGVYNVLSGAGAGDKYGTYSKIETTAGGTHYAVYGEAEKAGSYAGYFKGNVYVDKKITAEESGTDADMKAYIYGFLITSGDNIAHFKSSDGFTVQNTATGTYDVTFNDTSIAANYVVTATADNTTHPMITVVDYRTGHFFIKIFDINGSLSDSEVHFIVFKK